MLMQVTLISVKRRDAYAQKQYKDISYEIKERNSITRTINHNLTITKKKKKPKINPKTNRNILYQ